MRVIHVIDSLFREVQRPINFVLGDVDLSVNCRKPTKAASRRENKRMMMDAMMSANTIGMMMSFRGGSAGLDTSLLRAE